VSRLKLAIDWLMLPLNGNGVVACRVLFGSSYHCNWYVFHNFSKRILAGANGSFLYVSE